MRQPRRAHTGHVMTPPVGHRLCGVLHARWALARARRPLDAALRWRANLRAGWFRGTLLLGDGQLGDGVQVGLVAA
jgi:hypothetical protein